jgi:hypothetical protein
MAKYTVTVALTYHKDLEIYAKDEAEAEEKAEDICGKWDNVEDVEVINIDEH